MAVCDVARPFSEAVMTSEPAQPLSRYEAVAIPFTVEALDVNTAVPLPEQVDEKVTVCGEVMGTPPLDTVTLRLVVPKAESGAAAELPAPSVNADIVRVEVPIE